MNGSTGKTLVALLAALLSAPALAAVQYGETRDGRRLAMGGVGQEEDAQMRLQSSAYSLSLLTASRGSGAYLSDVQVDIRDARGELAFSGLVDGPRLMIMLAPGTYKVVALYGGETLVQSVSIVARGHRELVFYFQVPGE